MAWYQLDIDGRKISKKGLIYKTFGIILELSRTLIGRRQSY